MLRNAVEMTAPCVYSPMDVIHEEEPFAYVLFGVMKNKQCDACLKKNDSLKVCSQCGGVKYCNKICQKTGWKDHKYECKILKNLPSGKNKNFVRLLGKVILKIKDKKRKPMQTNFMETIKTFDDLDSRSKYLKEDPLEWLYWKEMEALTREYIGDENMPDENEFIEILGKVRFNVFLYSYFSSERDSGLFLFIGAPQFEHQCIPNCNMFMHEKKLQVWAIKDIDKGSKISVTHRLAITSNNLLMDEFVENCKCQECILPYGESILKKVIDEKRAYSVISATEKFLDVWYLLEEVNRSEEVKSDSKVSLEVLDEYIENQKDVLAPTHVLHLKTLALKCLKAYLPLQVAIETLKELENKIKLVYGEYYLEMIYVYGEIIHLNTLLHPEERMSYIYKYAKMLPPNYTEDILRLIS